MENIKKCIIVCNKLALLKCIMARQIFLTYVQICDLIAQLWDYICLRILVLT